MTEAVKLYFDYKSPFAYLAAEPAFALPERYDIALRIEAPDDATMFAPS